MPSLFTVIRVNLLSARQGLRSAAMLLSMTGFGRGEVEIGNHRCQVEIRSLNHRYCDITVRLPRQASSLEPKVRRAVQSRINRGKVDVAVNLVSTGAAARDIVVDYPLAGEISRVLKQISRRFDVREPDLTPFLSEIVTISNGGEDEELWPVVEAALNVALEGLLAFRRSEGAALAEEMGKLMARIETIVERVEELAPREPGLLQGRLEERLGELELPVDPQRLAQEVAFVADKVDIREEVVRMKSHIAQWREAVAGGSPCGRRLDFLVQEMHREASTMASKSRDAQIVSLTVELRDEIGKLKEQVQNVE